MLSRSTALVVVSSLLTLAGCSAPESGDLGTTSQDVTEVCGAKTTGPVQGVDVSHYQGNFDWVAAKVDFGYAQVSDGINSPDATFDANWAGMKKAHVLRGAYQFFRPGEDPIAQANLVVKKVGKLQPGDLPVMIDVEVTDGQSPTVIAANIAKWIKVVETGTGLPPFIYTGSYFWQDNVVSTAFGKTPIWIAAYGPPCPSVPPGWKNWLFWQYSDGNGKLDHDVFNGTLAQLKAYSPQPPTTATDAGAPHDAGASHDGGSHDAGTEKDAMGPEVNDPDASLGGAEGDGTPTPESAGDTTTPTDAPAPHDSAGCATSNMGSETGGGTAALAFVGALVIAARRRKNSSARAA
jgi:lysozyme